MRRWLVSPWLTVRCQIALGAIFVIAALPKLMDPPGFAKAIHAYKLFPAWGIHPAALFLPWLELIVGVLLLLGIWVRTASLWIVALLLAFIVALSINLARHHPVDCGCLGTRERVKSRRERRRGWRGVFVRDLRIVRLSPQWLVSQRFKPQMKA